MGRIGAKYVRADVDAKVHESLNAWWLLAEVFPKRHWNSEKGREERRMNLGRKRTMATNPLVHAVAFDRKSYAVPPGAIRVDTLPW